MKLRILTSLSLGLWGLWAAPTAFAQTAENFFNSGAQLYISNNVPAALEKTEQGLKLYPDNVKLQKLEKLLKQHRRQQSKQNQRQKQQNQSQPQQQSGHRKNQPQPNQQTPKQTKPQKKPSEARSSAEPARKRQGEENKKNQAQAPNRMTPKEAKRLLDAQKGNEQFLQLKPHTPPKSQQPVEDW